MNDPTAYAGMCLPFGETDPKKFEAFVASVLIHVGPNQGFRPRSGGTRSADGGFDVDCERISDAANVCVQCKRQKASLSIGLVGVELAKVALNGFLKNDIVKEHYFIATGQVTSDLRIAIRESSRQRLIDEACKRASTAEPLEKLRDEVATKGGDATDIVTTYVQGLDRIRAWSGDDFDSQLSAVWSQIQDPIARTFTVHTMLREHPRPDFDEARYLSQASAALARSAVPLRARASTLPSGLQPCSAADPLAEAPRPANAEWPASHTSAVTAIVATPKGHILVVVAPGGGGKSTTLAATLQQLAWDRSLDNQAPLPVLVSLSRYRGKLSDLVHDALGVTHGNWQSIPGPFLLLCDGLTEVGPTDAAQIIADMEPLLRTGRVAIVLTLRTAGLRLPVTLPGPAATIELLPLSLRETYQIAQTILTGERLGAFTEEVRRRFAEAGSPILSLPFALAVGLALFLERGALPNTFRELVEESLGRRFTLNRAHTLALRPDVLEVPKAALRALGIRIAFDVRVHQQRAEVHEEHLGPVIHDALAQLRIVGVLGADSLDSMNAIALLCHHGVLVRTQSGWYGFEHDLIADCLASTRLAEEWRTQVDALARAAASDEVWVFAAPLIPETDQAEFVTAVAAIDPYLAARCAKFLAQGARMKLEEFLLSAKPSGLLSMLRVALATGELGTDQSKKRLRLQARFSAPGNPLRWYSERSLLSGGDESHARHVLTTGDADRSSPFQMSGGNLAMWEYVPPALACQLARERIDGATPTTPLALSVETIARFGDGTDGMRLRHVLGLSEDLRSVQFAVTALRAIGELPDASHLASVAQRGDAHWFLSMSWTLHRAGLPLSPEPILECVFQLQAAEQGSLCRDGLKLLEHTGLPDDAVPRIRAHYDQTPSDARWVDWSLATQHNLANFEPMAVDALRNLNGDEFLPATRYAATRGWPAPLKEQFLATAMSVLEDEDHWFTLHCGSVLEQLARLGQEERVAKVVATYIQRLHAAKMARLAGASPTLNRGASNIWAGADEKKVRFDTEIALHSLMPVVAMLVPRLPTSVLVTLLDFDLSSLAAHIEPLYRDVLRQIDGAVLDARLARVEDPRALLSSLDALSGLGITRTRTEAVLRLARGAPDWPVLFFRLRQLVIAYWCDDVLSGLTEVIRAMPWRSFGEAQMAHELVDEVAKRISRSQAEALVRSSIAGCPHLGSRQILQLWCDAATRRAGST